MVAYIRTPCVYRETPPRKNVNQDSFYTKGEFSKRLHPSEVAGSIVNTIGFKLCTHTFSFALPTAYVTLLAWEMFARRYNGRLFVVVWAKRECFQP